ncbi:DUF4139 domain-containing protein [Myxococcus landrumensis]|uniref:DUF4139 domain-containing protein n=1 Tax=Myxococcus landrumensis TaxID=2813577 RepID=A0ABX7NDW7_9BACT|nr:DUF4140 domain-containing protein [Myxococcus landrumus]QSQ17012.1 DUF4139 domain-containing protein [Myxococcus landrumus]
MLLLGWAVAGTLHAAIDAPVTDVTVYSDSARVVRTATLDVSGTQRVELPRLPELVDPDSIRVEAEGAQVLSVEVRQGRAPPFPEKEARALVEALDRLDEEGLRVKRSTVGEEVQSKGLLGGKHRFRYVYRFELTNLRTNAETVVLSEHIPVSELDDVTVEVEPVTTAGFTVGKEDGIAVWKLALAPGEKRTVELAFHVDAPSRYSTLGM